MAAYIGGAASVCGRWRAGAASALLAAALPKARGASAREVGELGASIFAGPTRATAALLRAPRATVGGGVTAASAAGASATLVGEIGGLGASLVVDASPSVGNALAEVPGCGAASETS